MADPQNYVWKDFSYSALDGLTLRGRDYGSRDWRSHPVVGLPGLTRNSRDFDEIARRLSTDPENPRRFLALDYRGRGQSDYDSTWQNYNPVTEANDVINAISAAGMQDVILFGTSRGGIISMLLGSIRPGIIKGVILHDIGPEIDAKGLLRIKNYVSRMPNPRNWEDAADVLKTIHGSSFPNHTPEDWMKAARLTFRNEHGDPKVDYDAGLIKTLATISPDTPPPSLWPQFMSLRHIPLLTIRGEISDLLSEKTLEAMDRAHPTMKTVIVPSEGHVPSLAGAKTIEAIQSFMTEVDEKHGGEDFNQSRLPGGSAQ